MNTPLACLAVALMTGASASAATIAFLSNVAITSDAVLDTPLSYNAGATLQQAVTFGGSAQIVSTTGGQTISFAAGATGGTVNMPAAPSGATVVYNAGLQSAATLYAGDTGDVQFNAILDSNAWHNGSGDAAQPMTLRIGGLTIGQTYYVSLFSADARSTDRSQQYWDSFSGGVFSGGASGSFSQNPGTMTTGVFTADATFQDIFIQETDGIGFDDTNLSAFTLYAVPEPSSVLLVAGASLLGVLRRRRF